MKVWKILRWITILKSGLQYRNLDYNLEMAGDQFPGKFAGFSCGKCIEMSTNSPRNEAKNPMANAFYII